MLVAEKAAVRAPLDVVSLSPLMERTAGRAEVAVGLIDGPVAADHADLATENIRSLPSRRPGRRSGRPARHARMEPMSPASCQRDVVPQRRRSAPAARCWCGPSFSSGSGKRRYTQREPRRPGRRHRRLRRRGRSDSELERRARNAFSEQGAELEQALDHAAARGALVVAAAGNQGAVGGSAITRHPWVIPVAACDAAGRPMAASNLGSSIARRGLMAPGDAVTSLGTNGQTVTSGGTSAAAPFVTGAIALLWSMFPEASAAEVKSAVTRADLRRATVVPPLLDAWAAYQLMQNQRAHG